ncbi:MAG: hypothetical protein LOD87_07305 [Planifilum fulgidum]
MADCFYGRKNPHERIDHRQDLHPRSIRRPFGKGCIDSIILGEPSDLRFVGEQKGADWTLKSEGTDEPIEVTKKGDQIELVRSENRETLSERPGTISCCSGRRPDRHPPE